MLPTAQTLKTKYPLSKLPCNKKYENQCAIRMSLALMEAGVDLSSYGDERCDCPNHSPGRVRSAKLLARWLEKNCAPVPSKYVTNVKKAKDKVSGRSGIIYFQDCYTRKDGTKGSHIDLWLGESNSYAEKLGSDFKKAAQVWFWEV